MDKSKDKNKNKKKTENRNIDEEKIISQCEFIMLATGCGKSQAYYALVDNCYDPIEAIDKLSG